MSRFQDKVKADRDRVFLNPDYFAAPHLIEGKEVTCVMGADERVELSGGYSLGVSASSATVYAKVEDLPPRRNAGASLNVDGAEYVVNSWSEVMGMATIALSRPEGY